MIKRALGLTIWVFAFQLIAFLMHQFVHLHLSTWYDTIQKSPLHPPEIVFPIVWSTLYVMITIAGFLYWQERKDDYAKPAIYYYFITMLLTWGWSPIIFRFHWIALGFFWTLAIFVTTLMTIIRSAEKMEFPASLLAPYLLWLLYVAYLCGYLWLNN